MSLNVTLNSLSSQLDQLEKVKQPESRDEAEKVFNDFQNIFTRLHEVLSGLSGNTQPIELIAVQLTLNRVSELNDRFIRKGLMGVATDKTREMMRNIKG